MTSPSAATPVRPAPSVHRPGGGTLRVSAPALLTLTPLAIEAGAVRRGGAGGRVVRTGLGPRRSMAAAAGARRVPARAVAVAGFCAGLDPDLRPGDLVVATEVRGPDGVVPCPSSALVLAALRAAGLRARRGPVASIDHVARGPELERLRATGAIAVDMESAWLAAAADGRPLAVVRAVVDTPGQGLWNPVGTVLGGIRAHRSLRRAAGALRSWAEAAGARHVLLAGPRSFCAGVERAIEIVERALERHGPPVYVRKQIVHNVHVVRDLERKGAVFVDSEEEVPPGAIVVFSAHGVSPAVREQAATRSLHVIDATCPLVTKVHAEARRFAQAGYTIFLIGHHGHEEVEGTTGEAPGAIRLIERPHDLDVLPAVDADRVAYLSQTTLAVDEVEETVGALRDRFPTLRGPGSDDICYATQNRQDAVRALAGRCDLLLVIGSTNSSNSNRLVEVAEREGCRARLIDGAADIDPAWLVRARTVGLTAGASAPESLVDEVLGELAGLGPITVEQRDVTTESVRFTLPVELRPGNGNGGRGGSGAAAGGREP